MGIEQKTKCEKLIEDFRRKKALDSSNETVAMAMHLMNEHAVDDEEALDNSSRSGDDHGIDGWYFREKDGELFVYQSKFSESKNIVLAGLKDLLRAKDWLEEVLIKGEVEKIPDNQCLYNLYSKLSKVRDHIKIINFSIVSLLNRNELEDRPEYTLTKKGLVDSQLNQFMDNRGGKITLSLQELNCETRLPTKTKKYTVEKIEKAMILLGDSAHLDLSYIPLHSLVELYRQRGDILFDKNVRLTVTDTKETKDRLVHPMEETLGKISKGEIDANIFPFYHVGVTISATSHEMIGNNMQLESPSVINGCQTISIADKFLRELEKNKNVEQIENFNKIRVIAKIVIGVPDDDLREITISNNRQVPIDNWQLFSNDYIHREIEDSLKDVGVFYERQKGKFNALMKNPNYVRNYENTNNTFVDVQTLGQLICFSKRRLQWAAKPSEIFSNKQNHDDIFDKNIPRFPDDMIFLNNLFKAVKRGLRNYLDIPTHSNDTTQKIFGRSIVKAYMYFVAIMYFYQNESKADLRSRYSIELNKIAPPGLVSEAETFYAKIISKTKSWYLEESKDLRVTPSSKRLDTFLDNLCKEQGIDLVRGNVPFSATAIDWSEYEETNTV